jgi:chromosomal replication initiator protein
MASGEMNLWQQALAHVQEEHEGTGASALPPWLAEARLQSLGAGRMEVRLPRSATFDDLDAATKTALERSLQRTLGRRVHLAFRSAGSEGAEAAPKAAERPSMLPMARVPAAGQPRLNPQYTFENFVTGPCNRMAHAAAMAVGDLPGRAYNPLFVHASVGLGKSHLIQAICHKIIASRPDVAMMYVSCEDFVNQFISSIESGQIEEFRYRFRYLDVLVIDDIHFLAAPRDTAAGRAAGLALQVGPGGPDRPAQLRDPRGHHPEKGAAAGPRFAGRRRPVHRHHGRYQQSRTRRRRGPRSGLCLAL